MRWMLLNLEGAFGAWMDKRKEAKAAKADTQQRLLKQTKIAMKAPKGARDAANKRGEYLPISKTGR